MCHLRGTNIRISVTCSTCYRPFSGTWYTYHDDSQVCSQSPGTEKLMGKIQVKIAALIRYFGGGGSLLLRRWPLHTRQDYRRRHVHRVQSYWDLVAHLMWLALVQLENMS